MILIFLVLRLNLKFIDPLIIVITVPLAIAGALLSLHLFNQTPNIFSQIQWSCWSASLLKNGGLIVGFANKDSCWVKTSDSAIDIPSLRTQTYPHDQSLPWHWVLSLWPCPRGAASTSGSFGVVIVGWHYVFSDAHVAYYRQSIPS